MVGLRVATRVAFVMALTLFLAHGPTFGACSSWSYFTIIGKDNSPLKVGCQGQAYQSLRPWGKGEKIVQLEINTICKQQEWHNYFHDLDKETVKDKIVLVQFSDCLETWFQYEQTFFHVTAYLSLQTQARGIIIAERYRGKLPDSVVIEEKLHDFMDPVCIITGESYEQMIDAFSTSKSFDGTLEADMSSVLFFSSDTSDEEEVSAYESSIRQALKMWEAMSGSNAEALQTFTEAFEFYYPLKHYHNGSLFEMPLRRAETLGPRTSPEISAELVVAELTDACFQDSYSACSSCFQANSSERFQNAEALDGKVALVLVDAPWLGVQGCFRNYEDYPILLQELGVRGVILTSTSFSLPQEAWPMVDVKIPVFSIPYNYGVYLRKGFFDARPTDMLDDVSVFPFPEGNTEVVLPEYGEELDLQKAMMMKLLNEQFLYNLGNSS
ncbi:hypothetical protein HOP50_02g11990 [Chloropicon primus]|uniref:Uncharacterized protein n=1 Tax=Chloropicon primus TaxID=1764295 RepID=A0A5B8MEV1_9CHLO|nr:hypothetical protein A3770_02p12120 [Chloropicon primus]UPQ97902.1 hypothetical protein HOP50_02g11990 [Chloropicon primus]|eukprot:QDZ18694.1 hypothetical protein A3770_02p12120 [Chloropicon primus]